MKTYLITMLVLWILTILINIKEISKTKDGHTGLIIAILVQILLVVWTTSLICTL